MERLLERFCRYCRIDTQADDRSSTYPSTPGQLDLGRLLLKELLDLGLTGATQDEHGIVIATLPGTVPGAPAVAWIAHVDTSPETSGKDVKPQIHRNYGGGDIVLPGDPTKVLRPSECPELAALKGKTIVTTDGTTLLGGDDKAGVAVIMEAAQRLLEDPKRPRGPVRICFTCDEEIGHGVDHVDIGKLNVVCGYTLDGSGVGELDTETFSADMATVTVHGTNIHPAIAKGRMVNAVRLAGMFLDRLPRVGQSPETTEGREGFLHPLSVEGGVAKTVIRILLRDFDTPKLAERAEMLRLIGRTIEAEFPTARFEVEVKAQYRNMRDWLDKEPRALPLAAEAMRRAGIEPRLSIVRGGTDGSRLTEMGLPTPNLSTGEHNFHSPLEWVCLEELDANVRMLMELAGVWSEQR